MVEFRVLSDDVKAYGFAILKQLHKLCAQKVESDSIILKRVRRQTLQSEWTADEAQTLVTRLDLDELIGPIGAGVN